MFGQLLPCGGGDVIPLLKPRLFIGRSSECDLTIALGMVSTKHCLLDLREGIWHVHDLGSRNGIRIDGARCKEGRLLPGNVLWIASQRYQIDYRLPAAAATAESAPKSFVSEHQPPPGVSAGRDTDVCEPPMRVATKSPSRAATNEKVVELGELIPCGGGPSIPLCKPSLIVGRSPACDITLPFSTVSSKHCQLDFKGGFWHVRDLGSRNGIRVDGIVHLAKYLRPGEVLSIARPRYEIAYKPLAEEPPPDENPFELSLMEKAGLVGRRGAPPDTEPLPSTPDEPARKRWTIDEPGES
jgi:pSer/pThr/pTyr-binding forkhead associated (FHA) protein